MPFTNYANKGYDDYLTEEEHKKLSKQTIKMWDLINA